MKPRSRPFFNASRIIAAVMLAMGLTGCSNWPPQGDAKELAATCEAGNAPEDNTKLAAIEQMVTDGKTYAALAELDALNNHSDKAQLIKADALRKIDRTADAKAIYSTLLRSCVGGRAQHGLGLIAARDGDQRGSIEHLQLARQALPTDSRIRNDLGYAYLLAHRFDDAQFEFMTALDLNSKEPKARKNLVLLSLLKGEREKAHQLASSLGLDGATRERLAHQAANLNATLAIESLGKPVSRSPALSTSTAQTP
jgi:Flp pilus assembly protein TadD